jgi:hypothetical protein
MPSLLILWIFLMKSDSALLIPSLLNWPLIFVLKQYLFTSCTSLCGSFLIVSNLVGIDLHLVMVSLLVFPKLWRFPYPFGFCNPVRIYRRKINDDDEEDVLETERCSASQEIPQILLNLSVCIMGTRVHLWALYWVKGI